MAELDVNEIKANKRKDTIKNVAIAFLSIMLVLTFFSNTIRNYTLPTVATQAVQQGSISPQIRGTGTVAADDPYNLTVSETRKIASVAVKVGDTVKKGDVIYSLEDQESSELTDAQSKLDDLNLAYEQALFSGDVPDGIISKVRNGKTDTMDAYQEELKEVNDRFVAATKADAQAQATIDLLTYEQTYATALIDNNPETSQDSTPDATYELTRIKTGQTNTGATITDLNSQISALQGKLKDLDALRTARDAAEKAAQDAEDAVKNPPASKSADLLKRELEEANVEKADAQVAFENALSSNNDYNSQISDLKAQLETNKANLSTLNSESDDLNDILNQHTRDSAIFKNDYEKKLAVANGTKAQTKTALDQATKDRTDLLTSIKTELGLSSQQKQIKEAQAKVDRLRAKAIGASIKSPVDGTISSLAYAAGESTAADQSAAVIQVAGKPMTTSFSVTNEQAKKLKVGDEAQPQNAWFYTQFKATLKSIKPDTTDPAGKKLLTFQIVSPEVTTGQSVSLAIGESAQDYDMTVPNSAMREDNNGKFILVVQSKASPLGNRYIAQRVDVKVQASDDTTTAITASLNGDEYVITTVSAPVKAGQQVRLANTQIQ